jgi:hypothetical protein
MDDGYMMDECKDGLGLNDGEIRVYIHELNSVDGWMDV